MPVITLTSPNSLNFVLLVVGVGGGGGAIGGA